MTNQKYTGTPTSRRQPIACPSTVKAGDPVLIGQMPAVALDDFQSNIGGTTFLFGGSFLLTVIGQNSESPVVGAAINPGDKLYAKGTLDPTTNVTTGLTIDSNSGNTFFGYLDPASPKINSGVTNTAASVVLPNGM